MSNLTLQCFQKVIILGRTFSELNLIEMANKQLITQIYKIIFRQLIGILGLAVVMILLQGLQRGYSTLIGAMAYWLPTLLFLWRVAVRSAARSGIQFMFAFMGGEIFKLFLSAILFLLAVHYLRVDVVFGMLGLMGSVAAFFLTTLSVVYIRDQKVSHE